MVKNVKKKVRPPKRSTLDQQHSNHLKKFEKQNSMLPHKKKKLSKLREELSEYSRRSGRQGQQNGDIHRQNELIDEIRLLENEINNIENHTDSLKYAINVLPILIDYYDNDGGDGIEEEVFEEALPIATGAKRGVLAYLAALPPEEKAPKIPVSEGLSDLSSSNRSKATPRSKGTLQSKGSNGKVLKTGSGSKTLRTKPVPITRTVIKTKTTTVTKTVTSTYVAPKPRASKAKLFENYLSITDTTYRNPNKIRPNKCSDPNCAGEKVLCQNDGCIVCNVCGAIESTLTAVEKPNYKEPIQDTGTYAYKRINHLTEILSQLQAKESTEIPQRIYESILREIKKRKVDKNELDVFSLRKILKKLDFIKYYEHVPHILQFINGKKPPNFSREDEQRIKKMFKDIQKPFSIYCPKNRKNFLNYSYVLHKFCELLNLDEYIPYFPLLKNNSKLLQHDRIWKNICGYMRWAYYKSI